MPPKKAEAPVEKPVLGRFSSHLKIGANNQPPWRFPLVLLRAARCTGLRSVTPSGICGMPNVGKSTLFNVRGHRAVLSVSCARGAYGH